MARLEQVGLAFFLACWLVGLLELLDVVALAGSLDLGLYPLYSTAAATGWLAGNVYVHRCRRRPDTTRAAWLVLYYLGPPGPLYLLRAMAPAAVQSAAPFVPLYAFGVFTTLFLVPLMLGGGAPRRRPLQIGRRPPEQD